MPLCVLTDLALTGSDPHEKKYRSWTAVTSGSESGAVELRAAQKRADRSDVVPILFEKLRQRHLQELANKFALTRVEHRQVIS